MERVGDAVLARLPAVAVLALVALGFLAVRLSYWRRGVTLVGVALLVGAVLRAVLPPERLGGLTVRSRAADTLVLTTLGAAVVVLGLTVPYLPPAPAPTP